MSRIGDVFAEVEAMAVECGRAECEVSVILRDGVTVARVSWPGLAILDVERYGTADEARQIVGRRNVALLRP